jgi:colicin import membrane protein
LSEETGKTSVEGLDAQIAEAERRLKETAEAAAAAEQRAVAEVRALEADLEKERRSKTRALDELRTAHAEELQRERDAKTQAIATAEDRLAEIEAHADAAEKRVEEAERHADVAESALPDAEARAREAAAAWLRGQVEAIRREAGRR